MSPRRITYIIVCLVSFVGCFYSFYYFGLRPAHIGTYSNWLVFGPSLIFLILGFVFLCLSFSDNEYHIKEGRVIRHDFTPAHMVQAVYIPGTPGTGTSPGTPGTFTPTHWVDDDWALYIQDQRNHTGWLHFSEDVFQRYPVGSYYRSSVSNG